MNKSQLIEILSRGDMRTVGTVEEIVEYGTDHNELVNYLVEAMLFSDPGVRMRASDALEKISRKSTENIESHKNTLIQILRESKQQEVQWHLAQILPRLTLTKEEAEELYFLFKKNFESSKSSIVQVFSLQAMVDLRDLLPNKSSEIADLVIRSTTSVKPSLKSRAKKISDQLDLS